MLRIVHTSDWHLGHSLYEHPRTWEQQRFLDWLLRTLVEVEAHALIIAGDLFHTANPSALATRQWYDFVVACHQRLPHLQVVLIAGNHDSAARLLAPEALLQGLGVRVVGGLPRDAAHRLRPEEVVLPLRGHRGEIEALVAAVPFLRPGDLPGARELGDEATDYEKQVRWVYEQVLHAARARLQPHQALLATGHCYLVGGQLSELSERRLFTGAQHALPVDLFPEDVDYVALGHLHRPQKVGGRDTVRYAGSPLPLSFPERTYTHQVAVVDLHGPGQVEVSTLPVPRSVPMLQLPEQGTNSLEEALAALRALPAAQGDPEQWPWLRVEIHLDQPTPSVLPQIHAALEGRRVRLVEAHVVPPGKRGALADAFPVRDLSTLTPEAVFARKCEQEGLDPVPPELLSAFALLHQEAVTRLQENEDS